MNCLSAPCDGSRPATPAGCSPSRGKCSQQGCRGRSRRVLKVTAAGNGDGTFRHIVPISRNVPIACPNAYNTIAKPTHYDTPHPALSLQSRSIAPALFRGLLAPVPPPISGATRPHTPTTKKLVRCLFVACGFRNCFLAVALYRLFIRLLVACSLLARCCRHLARAWP